MVASIFKKNTLEQTSFNVSEIGFMYKGRKYVFNDVVETRSYRVIHQTRHIPAGITESHNPAMSFVLVMQDGENIQVTEQSTLFSSSKQERVNQLQKSFDEICAKTYKQRIQKYVAQIEAKGYFEYNGWHFAPKQQKIINASSGHAYLTPVRRKEAQP